MSQLTTLWYFSDPMCAWCWGFTPIMEDIRNTYSERMNIVLMLGGLRTSSTQPLTIRKRDEIMHHWFDSHRISKQPFTFEGALPEGFIFNTEPACRAVITVAALNPAEIFPYFKTVQTAFFVEQLDVTQADILVELATRHRLSMAQFSHHFNSDDARQKTQKHFRASEQAGVFGFPALVLEKNAKFQFITQGYRPLQELMPPIEACLKK